MLLCGRTAIYHAARDDRAPGLDDWRVFRPLLEKPVVAEDKGQPEDGAHADGNERDGQIPWRACDIVETDYHGLAGF